MLMLLSVSYLHYQIYRNNFRFYICHFQTSILNISFPVHQLLTLHTIIVT